MKNSVLKIIYFLEHKCFENPYSEAILKSIIQNSSYWIFLLQKNQNSKSSIIVFSQNHQLKENSYLNLNLNKKNIDPIGYSIFLESSVDNFLELLRIGILPEKRNQDSGYFLLKNNISFFKSFQKYNAIYLEVSEKNHPAIQLYKKIGFVPYVIRKKYYNSNESAICMKFNLT